MRPSILQMNGLSLGDFESREAALATADDLIATNSAEFDHKVEPQVNKNPLLTKYWYVKGEGTKRSFSQTESKELQGSSDVKNRKLLTDAQAFMEGLGPAGSAEEPGAQVENVAFADMKQSREKLRTHKYYIT